MDIQNSFETRLVVFVLKDFADILPSFCERGSNLGPNIGRACQKFPQCFLEGKKIEKCGSHFYLGSLDTNRFGKFGSSTCGLGLLLLTLSFFLIVSSLFFAPHGVVTIAIYVVLGKTKDLKSAEHEIEVGFNAVEKLSALVTVSVKEVICRLVHSKTIEPVIEQLGDHEVLA